MGFGFAALVEIFFSEQYSNERWREALVIE